MSKGCEQVGVGPGGRFEGLADVGDEAVDAASHVRNPGAVTLWARRPERRHRGEPVKSYPMNTPRSGGYVEQAYFFRTFLKRMADNMPAQEVLESLHQELLSSTRMPMAIQFLATEIKHSGLLATGLERLPHYFTKFQAFSSPEAEDEGRRIIMPTARSSSSRRRRNQANPDRPGCSSTSSKHSSEPPRYLDGIIAMEDDPLYDADWTEY